MMKIKIRKPIKALIICILIFSGSIASIVFAAPGTVACAFIEQAPLKQWSDKLYSESRDSLKHKHYVELLLQARMRINNHFGESTSTPYIVFFDSTRPIPFFKPNPYGSVQFAGSRACIFVGPKGQNTDVVSHELVHADIFELLGTVNRTLYLPTWLDEGLAMQVDYRSRYDLTPQSDQDLAAVHAWDTYREFSDVEAGDAFAFRYALAKARVKKWVEVVGTENVYKSLRSLVSGGMNTHTRNLGLVL